MADDRQLSLCICPINPFYSSSLFSDIADLNVWTSSLVRTHQTAANIPAAKISFKELDEIHAGTFDGMTYDEVAEMHPEEYKARGSDKLNYRYPKGKFRKNSEASTVAQCIQIMIEIVFIFKYPKNLSTYSRGIGGLP